MLSSRFVSIPVLLVVSLGACAARQPGQTIKPGFNMFSKEQDVQLGREAAQQVTQQYQLVRDQNLQNYLKRIGERLAATPSARQSGFPFTFSLLNENSVNAFALPGGPMFVFSGLLRAADNEAQLAGVMAHEMSHVILRHGTSQASKANLIQLPAMLAGAVVGNGSLLGQLAQLGIGFGANSILLKYSRSAESDADALGARMMSEAGYNPIEMARFFEKLEAEGGARGPQFLSDHPNPGNRMRAIEAEIRALPQGTYGFETGEFSRAKSAVGSLPAAPKRNTRSSYEPPQGAPSGGMRELRGARYALNYPADWQAFGDNNSAMITLAPREALVQDSRGGVQVGYGAILSYFFPEGGRGNLRDATDELIHHLHSANPSMQVASRNSRRVRVDGSDGLVTMLESASPFGGAEQDALLTVARPEGVFYMIFIAPSRNFGQLQGTFDQMIRSLRFAS